MAIYIEQDPAEVRSSFEVQRRAEIRSLRLLSASLKSHPAIRKLTHPLDASIGFQVTSAEQTEKELTVVLDFTLSANDSGEPPQRAYRIKCAIAVTYDLEHDFEPSEEQLKAFSQANAVFNAWPFFREFSQSAGQRMGLKEPPIIPFLKLIPKAKNGTADKEMRASGVSSNNLED